MVKTFSFNFFIVFLLFNDNVKCSHTINENIRKFLAEDIFKKLLYELDLQVLPNITRSHFHITDENFNFDEKNVLLEDKFYSGTSLIVGNIIQKIVQFIMPTSDYGKNIEKVELVIPSVTINHEYDIIDIKILHILNNGTHRETIGNRKFSFDEMVQTNKIDISIYNDKINNLISDDRKLDLEILATSYNYNQDNYLIPSEEITLELNNQKPYITYKIFSRYNRRNVRSEYKTCDGTLNDGSCCLKNFKIDVSQHPWNFIISPSILNIKSCIGSCIKNDYSTTNSNFIRYSEDSEHKSCCYASEYETIRVLYATDDLGTLKFKNITNLIAKACRCY
ncbi:Transforming growth factor-beta, C-terminal domain-containing protein [Strongyloides ratti]|uniref:Transforming growth factor-beta, C-terminal domain-containing protein n=1 Tax=Strongyloides ratti TaxID=34506 RepID=A0A090LHJ6_STRRB|nr:Transforming growth factor-beta, C-terminal domain-containing protein [Strongyloides ratti]CEF69261.1 Transforming growth factor-beta, C-terminal domain-containing protein [Strongyloides ratti]